MKVEEQPPESPGAVDATPRTAAGPPASSQPTGGAKVLLVDDSQSALLALEAILTPLGYLVLKAGSGEEALKYLLHNRVAVIVMDVRMPGLDGFETARLIKARERSRHIPIIFVTGLSREASYVMSAYSQGAVDYLLKPVEPDILRAKISVFMALHERGEQLKAQAVELAERRLAEEEARRTAEFQKQLLAIVGHDIRTPLATVLGAAQMLKRSSGPDFPPQSAKSLDRIIRGGRRIEALVGLLVDFTRARLGHGLPIRTTPTDLHELLVRLVDEMQSAFPDHRLLLSCSGAPVQLDLDPDRISQVVSNLVSNAVAYGQPGTPISVALEDDADEVRFSVHNQGRPIPAAMQRAIFEPFRRGKGDGGSGKSLGLGLFIVREVVRAHGGEVEVHSAEGEGTRFTVTLPRRSASDATSTHAAPALPTTASAIATATAGTGGP